MAVKKMIERPLYLERLCRLKDKDVIKVVTGIRRCGKSTLLIAFQHYLQQQGIDSKQIIAINLESGDFRHLRTAEALYDYVEALLQKGKQNYVFLDEIQNVANFQQAVDWLYTKENVDLYITGSNAFLLSGELATLISGRYIEIKMLPLSFKEYTTAFPQNQNLPQLYAQYLLNSSFPGALEFLNQQDRQAYLEGIYNTILIKDVATRKKIADISALQRVVEFMYDNIGNLCSATKIANTMTSAGYKISVPTVDVYLQALTDSFILYKARRYDIKGKERLKSGAKYYAVDIGLRYFLLGSQQKDSGHILENVVYLELLRRGYEVYVGKNGTAEVDFLVIRNGQREYYQVSQSVLDERTLKRELAPLQNITDQYPKFLLTMDYLPLGDFNGIRQINVFDWLVNKNMAQG